MSSIKNLSHPGCMMPDGAQPCDSYTELYELALKLEQQIHKMKNCYNCKKHTHSDYTYYYEAYKICDPCLDSETLINWEMKYV